MLRSLKLATVKAASRLGVEAAVLNSGWRRERLAILCYHGISLDDEHLCRPRLYMPADVFRKRMELLRRMRANVLPLHEALVRLREGSLPPRSVVITFDDGNYDFYRQAFPVLQEFGFPATVYLTTYYSFFNRPVFDVMLAYLVYRGIGRTLEIPEILPRPVAVTASSSSMIERCIRAYALDRGATGAEKDELLARVAASLGVDYGELCSRRLVHIMTPDEAAEVARAGIAMELHTHRHRVSNNRELFVRELEDNGERIREITGRQPSHFCYPGGFLLPEFPQWLREAGVQSATTCNFGLATRDSDPFLVSRLLDASHMTEVEFSAWVAGTAAALPMNRIHSSPAQLMEFRDKYLPDLVAELQTIAGPAPVANQTARVPR